MRFWHTTALSVEITLNIKPTLRTVWLMCRSLLLNLRPTPRAPKIMMKQVKRILLIRQDRLGDVVLTSALIPKLQQMFPEAEIVYWIRQPFVSLFEESGAFSAVSTRPEGGFDLVIDPVLDYPLKSAKQAASFNAVYSLGFDVAGRGRYFTYPINPPESDELFMKSLVRLLEPLAHFDELAPAHLEVTALERAGAREIAGFEGEYVLVHPGAFYSSQRWPEKHVAMAVDMLVAQGLDVVVIGADADRGVLEEIRCQQNSPEDVRYLCGESLRIVMALMAEASLVLCNNSGPLHLVTALGVPTVSTLGPTNPKIWWPVGEHQHVLVAPDCDHCEVAQCSRNCLERIRPDEVVEKINQLLRSR